MFRFPAALPRLPAEATAITSAQFEAPICCNCGADLRTPFCGRCGQKKAQRFGGGHLAAEIWEKLRWFEADMAQSALRLLSRPGTVARDYVLGARKRYVHPLKLLLVAIALMLLVTGISRYQDSAHAQVNQAMALVRAYSNWSFSLGIVAIFTSTWAVFRRRLGYNALELLVLALYVQFLVLCAKTVNLLPTLIWRAPEWITAHKAWTPWYMGALDAGLLVLALRQFFLLDWRRDGWRLLLAAALYTALKWSLVQAYAKAVIALVRAQLT